MSYPTHPPKLSHSSNHTTDCFNQPVGLVSENQSQYSSGNLGVFLPPPPPQQPQFGVSDVNLPHQTRPMWSDQNPWYQDARHLHPQYFNDKSENILRKKKLWVSSLRKQETAQTPDNFSVDLTVNDISNIRYIKPIQVNIKYIRPAAEIINAFVLLSDFKRTESTSDGTEYSFYFPVIDGAVGTTVKFNYIFSTDYIIDFPQLDKLNNRLRVKIFNENATTGAFEQFTSLVSCAVEFEVNFIEHSKGLEKEVAQ